MSLDAADVAIALESLAALEPVLAAGEHPAMAKPAIAARMANDANGTMRAGILEDVMR